MRAAIRRAGRGGGRQPIAELRAEEGAGPGARPWPGRGALVAAAVLALSTAAFFRVALLPAIGSDLRLRPGLLSLITVVFGVGRLLADLPAGRLADRVPPLRALGAAGLAMGAGSALLAGSRALAPLLGAALVLGAASSFTNTTGMAFFSHAPARRRGTSLAVFSAALLGGQSLGPAVAGVVADAAGWRTAIAAAAAGAAAIGAVCVALPAGRRAARESAHGPARSGPGDAIPALQRAVLYAVPFSVFFALASMPQTLLPLIGAHAYGLSAGTIGLVLGAGGLCRFAAAAAGGVVSDRRSRKVVLVPGLALMAGGSALLALHGGPAVWVASVVLLALGSFGATVAAAMLADLGGSAGIGRRLGTFRFVGDLGVIAGPLASGWLYDRLGTVAAVAAVAGVLGACALASALVLPETRHRHG